MSTSRLPTTRHSAWSSRLFKLAKAPARKAAQRRFRRTKRRHHEIRHGLAVSVVAIWTAVQRQHPRLGRIGTCWIAS
jgi:hypothetical protein